MDASLDHIRDVESKFETDEEIYQLRRKITLPQAKIPELVDIGKGFFILSTSCWWRILEGYIGVGDGCGRRNLLETTLRCWWRFWPFLLPTFSFIISIGHQHPKDVTNIKSTRKFSPTECHQQNVTNIRLSSPSM